MSETRQDIPNGRLAHDARMRRLETYAKFAEMAFVEQHLQPLLHHAARLLLDLMDIDLVEILKRIPDDGWIMFQGAGWREDIVGDQVTDKKDSPMDMASNQAKVLVLTNAPKGPQRPVREQVPDYWKHHEIQSSALIRIGDPAQVWGVLAIHRCNSKLFHDEEIKLVEDLGALLGLAIDRQNDRENLETKARRAIESKDELSALYRVSKTVLEGNTLETTIESVTEESRKLVGASLALMATHNGDKKKALRCVSPSKTALAVERTLLQAARKLIGEQSIGDRISLEPVWVNNLEPEQGRKGPQTWDNVLVAPVTLAGQTVSILAFAGKPGGFSSRDAAVAASFANLAALAMDRHEAWTQARQQGEHVHHLADLALAALEPFDLQALASRTLSTIEAEVQAGWGLVLTRDTQGTVRAVAMDPDWVPPGGPGGARATPSRHRSPAFGGTPEQTSEESGVALDIEGTMVQKIMEDGKPRFLARPLDRGRLLPGSFPDPENMLFVPIQYSGRILGATVLADIVFDSRTALESAERLVRPLALGTHAYLEEIRARKLEEQLRRAQRLESVGRLAGGVAHDFNNLLTAIMSYTDMAMRQMGPQHPSYGDLGEVLEASERAARLTRQLLAFSRRQLLRPEVIDLNEVIGSMHGLLQKLLGEDIEILLQPGRQSALVKADRGQMEQVVMNLVVNARDAMPDGGTLIIETDRVFLDETYCSVHEEVTVGSYSLLAVTDTGIGMDAQTMAQIFDPFFTTKQPGQGTGLGLSTVYGIVKQSGGSLWCYSEEGRGTTFKIYLPAVEGAVDPTDSVRSDSQTPVAGKETLLVAEDESSVRQALQKILQEAGYRVLTAADGHQALALAKGHDGPIDLLLTDVIMPGMNGRELADRLAETEHMKVIYISGYTDNAVSHAGILDRHIHFLAKPFSRRQLLEMVRRVLDAKQEGGGQTNGEG